jgi:phosphopantetheine--protein transferase-like protein
MPLVLHHLHTDFQISLWNISEEENFFTEKISYRSTVSHLSRRTQQLAARFLLKLMQPEFPFHEVESNISGKPVLGSKELHFSLSHCNNHAAAIISNYKQVGVDVEQISPRVLKIEKKFLNPGELKLLSSLNEEDRIIYATLFWSMKESVFKWWGRGQIDFSDNIKIQPFLFGEKGFAVIHFQRENLINLQVNFLRIDNIWLTYLIS